MIVFGYEKFKEDGDPLDNCRDYAFENWKICDTNTIFLNMFQRVNYNYLFRKTPGEFNIGMSIKIRNVKNLKDEKYFFPISVKEFSGALGKKRHSKKIYKDNVFNHIPEGVLEDVRNDKCKIIIDFGYEGYSKYREDTILFEPLLELFHKILDNLSLPPENIIYLDGNNMLEEIELSTKINYFHYEYCAIDQWRFTSMRPEALYHGNRISNSNKKKWLDGKDKIREKYFLSFNRLPKLHRISLVLLLEKYNLLDLGYVSFGNVSSEGCKTDYVEDWKQTINQALKTLGVGFYFDKELKTYQKQLEKKLPLVIDKENLNNLKHSYEPFDISYYLNSYFQIVTENQFTDCRDQLQFSEKVWKPITNFQPFILLGDRYQLKKLREWGFKTFHPFIDESYDDFKGMTDRFTNVEKQIVRLGMKSKKEIHKWYWSMEEILVYNYKHFYNNFIKNQTLDLLGRLEGLL
jgi:hypothetical protein